MGDQHYMTQVASLACLSTQHWGVRMVPIANTAICNMQEAPRTALGKARETGIGSSLLEYHQKTPIKTDLNLARPHVDPQSAAVVRLAQTRVCRNSSIKAICISCEDQGSVPSVSVFLFG